MSELQDDQLIGKDVDGYRIEALLGQGGMARVYRALDIRLSRYAAIKVIDPQVSNRKAYHARFDKEARAVAQLKHPNIVAIYRFNEVDGLYYMAMEYVDGADLRWIMSDFRADDQLIPHKTVLHIVSQIAGALDYSHEKGVIHRDIKPSNIMITRQGDAILTDFGLALLMDEGTRGDAFGSPHYIAPEQAMNSATVVTQSDLYSLGVVVYEMLVGVLPFDDESALQIAMAHISTPPPDPTTLNPGLHAAFVPVLQKALAKDPEDRYETGAAFVKDLRRAVNSARATARDPRFSTMQPAERIARRVTPLPNITTIMVPPAEPETRTEVAAHPDDMPPPTDSITPQPTSRRWLRLLVGIAVITGVGAGIFALVNPLDMDILPTPAAGTRVAGAIEGELTRVEGNMLALYDVPVQVPADAPFLSVIASGDMLRLEGDFVEAAGGFTAQTITAAYIDGALFEEEEPEEE